MENKTTKIDLKAAIKRMKDKILEQQKNKSK